MPESLPGDGREYRLRWFAPPDQRSHLPQRGLLVGKLPQPCLAAGTAARRRTGGMARAGAGIWRVHKADGSPVPSGAAGAGAAAMASG